MLAWIPFLQPAPHVSAWWWLLVLPLSVFLSMTWRALRDDEGFRRYWPSVWWMSARIVLGMAGLFAALAIVVRVVVPLIPAE
jgi:hypothetical protein